MERIFARKCDLRIVKPEDEKAFLDLYHYQKYVASSICFGLYYSNELVELMSFGKPRFNKVYDHELLRLCTKKDLIVTGGASRLLKAFTSQYPGSIVSYCNENLFTGHIYEVLGFTKTNKCKSYHYEKDGKSYNRIQFQKHKILKMWPDVDSSKTEQQIMKEKGYEKVDEWQSTWVLNGNSKHYIYKISIDKYTYIGQHTYESCTNINNDGYFGSGTILKRLQKKYKTLGVKTILFSDLDKKSANEIEIDEIKKDKENNEFNINIMKGGEYYSIHGCGSIPGNKGKHLYIDENNNKIFTTDEDALSRGLSKGESNFKGKHHSEESKQKNRDAHIGKSAWNKNTHWSDEIKQKISNAKKGKKHGNQAPEAPEGYMRLGDYMSKTNKKRFQIMRDCETKKIGVWVYVKI